jgi:signal transduction histidine kinase
VLIRQGMTVLEQAQWRREREAAQTRVLAAQANEQAVRQTNHQLEAFLGIVSHELKTPLSSLLLSLQLLQRRLERQPRTETDLAEKEHPGKATSQEMLELSMHQLGRLNRLVNDLVDTSRIQAGRLEFQMQYTDLSSLIEQVAEEYRQLASEERINLKQSEQRPVLVMADAERVRQVVANYLSNALKYSALDCPVEVGVQQEPQQGRVWVRDQGPGIPLEEQGHVWERFHRVAGVEVQSGSGIGLGLGLHISKTIIAQHQGQVGIESTPGQGSTFWFTLPLAALPDKVVPDADT